MSSLQLNLLGPPGLSGPGGESIPFRTRKQLAVLVYLALEGRKRGVPRDRLVDLLWPGIPLRKARHSLSQALTAIRNALGPDAIPRGEAFLRLSSPIETDLDRPTRPVEPGVALPRPLQDLDDVAGPEFAHWVDRQRTRILGTIRRALVRDIRSMADNGDRGAVRERAEQLYRIDPRNEATVHLLTEQVLLEGESDRAVELLEEFLEVASPEPDGAAFPKSQRLLARLKAGADMSLPYAASRGPHAAPIRPAPFVGRQRELEWLEGRWSEAEAGRLVTCLVSGEAGIGKSTVVQRFARSIAARGHVVLTTTCQSVARDIPFAAIADLIDALSREPDLGGTDPHWLAEASRISPSLRDRFPGIPEPTSIVGETVRLSIAEAFARMLETVTEECGVLIVIDDVHHLDHSSRDVLHLVTRRMHTTRGFLLVLPCLHPQRQSNDAPLNTLWDGIAHLVVEPLSVDEGLALATVIAVDQSADAPPPDIATRLAGLSDGNPYFLELLARDWAQHKSQSLVANAPFSQALAAWNPPKAMRDAFHRQYGRLPSELRTILELIAVTGRSVTPARLAIVGNSDINHIAGLMEYAIQSGILKAAAGGAVFKNELHERFFYYVSDPSVRQFRHARLADAIHDTKHPDLLLEAAHHYACAAMPSQALECAVEGARAAIDNGAPHAAADAVTRTIERIGTADAAAVLCIIEALCIQGLYAQTSPWFDRLKNLSLSTSQQTVSISLHAETLVRGGGLASDQTRESVTQSLTKMESATDPKTVARIILVAAEFYNSMRDFTSLRAMIRKTASIRRKLADTRQVPEVLLVEAFIQFTTRAYRDAKRQFHAAVEAAIRRREVAELVRAYNGIGLATHALGQLEEAERSFLKAMDTAENLGNHSMFGNVASNMAVCYADFARWQEAKLMHNRALGAMQRAGPNRYEAKILINAAEFEMIVGNNNDASNLLDTAERLIHTPNKSAEWIELLLNRAELELALGNHDAAVEFVDQATRLTSFEQGKQYLATPGFDFQAFALLKSYTLVLQNDIPAATKMITQQASGPAVAQMEKLLFLAWLEEREGIKGSAHSVAAIELRQTGLFGTAARLGRMGLLPDRQGPWDLFRLIALTS